VARPASNPWAEEEEETWPAPRPAAAYAPISSEDEWAEPATRSQRASIEKTAVAPEEEDRIRFSLSAGLGVTGFSEDDLRRNTDIGLAWDVRAVVGAESVLALEAAYVGSVQQADLLIADTTLVGHGLETALRVNLSSAKTRPYLFGGLGWTNYELYFSGARVNIPADDDVLTVPVGAGLAFRSGRLTFDFRGTYRFAFNDELFRQQEIVRGTGFDSWSFTARTGITF